jgi:hypothetical protein
VQYFHRVGVPLKLVRLNKMCLNKTYSKVRIGKHWSDSIPIRSKTRRCFIITTFQLCFRILSHVLVTRRWGLHWQSDLFGIHQS